MAATTATRSVTTAALAATLGRAAARPSVLVGVAGAVGLGWLGFMLLRRADGLAVGAYDLAFFQQVVWNAGHGAGFTSSFNEGGFLGLHFSPLLAVPVALELAWADARLLSLLHAAALAATGPATYLLLRAALRPSAAAPWLAAGLAIPLPFWLAMQEAARADFHTEALALPLALLAGWAGLSGRILPFWALAFAALLAREDQAYTVAVIGILVAARARGRLFGTPRIHGVLACVVAAAWLPLTFGILMPVLRDGAALDTGGRYVWLSEADFAEVGLALVRQSGWLAAGGMVASVAALPLLAPRWALLALPPLAANLLSRHDPQPQLGLQYGLLLIVPLVVAAAMGGRRLLVVWRRQRHAPLLLLAGGPAIGLALLLGSLPPALSADPIAFERAPALERLHAVIDAIPVSAPLAVDDNLASALASRPRISIVPEAPVDAYLLLDRQPLLAGHIDVTGRASLIDEVASTGRPLLADDGRFQVWGPVDD